MSCNVLFSVYWNHVSHVYPKLPHTFTTLLFIFKWAVHISKSPPTQHSTFAFIVVSYLCIHLWRTYNGLVDIDHTVVLQLQVYTHIDHYSYHIHYLTILYYCMHMVHILSLSWYSNVRLHSGRIYCPEHVDDRYTGRHYYTVRVEMCPCLLKQMYHFRGKHKLKKNKCISIGNSIISRAIMEKHAGMSFSKTAKYLQSICSLWKTHECMFFRNCTRNYTE